MKRVVWAYYGFQTFFTLYLWLPIFYAYQRLNGLEDAEIFGIQSTYYVVFCFLEIPTGFMSDRWGHRRVLRLAALTQLASHGFAIFAPTPVGMLVHFLLLAGARSLVSGAASAYLYDYLLQRGAQDRYREIEGNARALGLGAKVIGWSAVGWLMAVHASLPYVITAALTVVAFAMVLLLPPLEGAEGWMAAQGRALSLREYRASLASPALFFLMVMGATVFVAGRVVQVNAYQPLLDHNGFALEHHGAIMAAMTLVEAVGSGRTGWLARLTDNLGAMLSITLGVCVSMVLLALGPWAALCGLMLFAWTTGLAYPIQKQLLNDAIRDSRMRATIMSLESILHRAASAPMALVLGGFVAGDQIGRFMVITAGLGLALTVGAYLALRFAVGFRPAGRAAARP